MESAVRVGLFQPVLYEFSVESAQYNYAWFNEIQTLSNFYNTYQEELISCFNGCQLKSIEDNSFVRNYKDVYDMFKFSFGSQ